MPHTLAAPATAELLLRKSRFIACVQPVPDRAAAQAIVAALRVEHPCAAHVCWALMAGGQSAADEIRGLREQPVRLLQQPQLFARPQELKIGVARLGHEAKRP